MQKYTRTENSFRDASRIVIEGGIGLGNAVDRLSHLGEWYHGKHESFYFDPCIALFDAVKNGCPNI